MRFLALLAAFLFIFALLRCGECKKKKSSFSFDSLLSGLDGDEKQMFKEELEKEVKKFHVPKHKPHSNAGKRSRWHPRHASQAPLAPVVSRYTAPRRPPAPVTPGVCDPICEHQCVHGCDFRCCIPHYQVIHNVPRPLPHVSLPGACSVSCSPTCYPECTPTCCAGGKSGMFQSSIDLQRMYPPVCPPPCSPTCFPHCEGSCCAGVNSFTKMYQQQRQQQQQLLQQQMQLKARQNIQRQQQYPPSPFSPRQPPSQQQQQQGTNNPYQMMNQQMPMGGVGSPGGFSHCGAQCPQTCAPSCMTSCCMQSAPAIMPSPVAAPVMQPMMQQMAPQCQGACSASCAPSCLPSCCIPQPPPPVVMEMPVCSAACPATCAPSCLPSCCGGAGLPQQLPGVAMMPPLPAQVRTVASLEQQQKINPNSCPAYCPDHCLPDCTQSCCDPSPPSSSIDKKSKISKIAAQLAMLRRKRSSV